MAYKSKICVLFVILFNKVLSSDCDSKDLSKLFDNGVGQCDKYVYESWMYSEVPMGSDVTKFLTPNSKSSCITSRILPLADGDVIEVNVYAKSITEQDYVTVLIYEATENKVMEKATLSKEDHNVNGNNVLKITLSGHGYVGGYIMLMGAVSTSSVLLVESICHTSALNDKPQKENLVKLTTNYRAPDIYVLHTDSVLRELVYPSKNVVMHSRALRFIDFEDFWTPLTITLAVAIPLVILILIGWGCYALGKRNGGKQEPDIIYEDVNNLPKPYLVPRAKSAYTESATGSSYGGRNNVYPV